MSPPIQRELTDILSDITDEELRLSSFLVNVVDRITERRFKIQDDSKEGPEIFLEFDDTSSQFYLKQIAKDKTLKLFGLKKKSQDTVVFHKLSYMKLVPGYGEVSNSIYLSQLEGKSKNSIIKETMILKVLKINDEKSGNNARGTFKNLTVSVADKHDNRTNITFWGSDVKKVARIFKVNCIYKIDGLRYDSFPTSRSDQISNLSFTGQTNVQSLMLDEKIVNIFQNITADSKYKTLEGEVFDFRDFYEYQACPGKNGRKCAKKIMPGQKKCDRIGCIEDFEDVKLFDNFSVTLIFRSDDGTFHEITAWAENLSSHLESHESGESKLQILLTKSSRVTLNPPSEPMFPTARLVHFEFIND